MALHDLPNNVVARACVYARCRQQAFTAERLLALVEVVRRLGPSAPCFVVLADGEWSDALTPQQFASFVAEVASSPEHGRLVFSTGFGIDDVTCTCVGSSPACPDEAAAIEVVFSAKRLCSDLDAAVAWFAALVQVVPQASSGTLALGMGVTIDTLPTLYDTPGLDVSSLSCVRTTLCVDQERAAAVAWCTFLSSSLRQRCLHDGAPHEAMACLPCGEGVLLCAPPTALLARDDDAAAPLVALGAALAAGDALHAPGPIRYGTWVLHGSDVVVAQRAAILQYHHRFASSAHLAAFQAEAAAAHALRADWLRQQSTPLAVDDDPCF